MQHDRKQQQTLVRSSLNGCLRGWNAFWHFYCRIVRLAGWSRQAWNREYDLGRWCCEARSPHTANRVVELCKGGRLIEFGCGTGSLLSLLPPGTYSEYIGVDISDVAIQSARQKAVELGLTMCRFEQGDMSSWPGSPFATLILIEECLYYLKPVQIKSFLMKCCSSLAPDGAILVIVHSARKHKKTLEVCQIVCEVINRRVIGSRVFLTLGPLAGKYL